MRLSIQLNTVFSLFLIFASFCAQAEEIPAGGEYDRRIKFIDYKSAEVVKLIGHYGFSTHIQFSPTETVKQIAMGDKDAWDVAPVKNHIFIKPKDKEPTTNMTVVTTRRVYNFVLTAHWSKNGARPYPNDMFFQVNFRYPEELAARAAEEAEAYQMQMEMNKIEQPLPANWNYWAKGSTDVSPSKAFDNGRFTYLKFENNSEMPAIYVVNEDNTESLVNTNIDPDNPDTIVIHKVARQLVMRKGKSVACIFNRSYDPIGKTNKKGTTTPGIMRVIRGSQK